MHRQQVGWSSGLRALSPAALECLQLSRQHQGTFGFHLSGTSKDGTLGWQAFGSVVEVFRLLDGRRVAAWCFGTLLKEPNTVVTALAECCCGNGSKLLVATAAAASQSSMISMLDISTSKIVKSIEMSYKVTCMEVLLCNEQSASVVFSEHLRCFKGILSAGTHCGKVYLIDLCLDVDSPSSNEVSPSHMKLLDPSVRGAARIRSQAIREGCHLTLELGAENHSRGFFFYRKPDSSHIKTVSEDDIEISSLQFLKHAGQLAVGFSFGSFQLWRLSIPTLEYSSHLEEDLLPITHFAFQEPENDPRNFSYLWVGRSALSDDNIEGQISNISLIQLGFIKKSFHEGFGHLYDELTSVGLRFEQQLTHEPFSRVDDACIGSRLLKCAAICDPFFIPSGPDGRDEVSIEGSGQTPDISRSAIVWEAFAGNPPEKTVYLAVFDINRWYHAQMPTCVRMPSDGLKICSYFSVCSVNDVVDPENSVLDIHLGHRNISKFISPVIPPPESLFFPSSLTLDTHVITNSGVIQVRFLSIQQQILATLRKRGSAALMLPSQLYAQSVWIGLIPRQTEASPLEVPVTLQREALLSMALDHGLVNYIAVVTSEWSTAEFTSVGCNMRFLLEWAWKKVTQVKARVDQLCACLYDWSGFSLDQRSLQQLHHCETQLGHLVTVFRGFLTNCSSNITQQGCQELEQKLNVVTLLKEYTSMVLLFLSLGLLPELSEHESGHGFSFPSQSLREAYAARRKKILRLHNGLSCADVLLVDALMQRSGSAILKLWQGDCKETVAFPPHSIHSVLGMYLVDGVDVDVKRFLTFYLLCDLVATAQQGEQGKMNEWLQQFSQACMLSTSINKMIQGMWLLDHADFEDALSYLLDPTVHPEILSWQHTCIVKAFLYQGHQKLALKYISVVQPPISSSEAVKLHLTVLLANKLMSEAFEFQRKYRDMLTAKDLLSHMVLASQQMKTIDQLLHLPFSADEEKHLIAHLKESSDVASQELLMVYFLQRARYVEAIQLNSKLRLSADLDSRVRERAKARNGIIDGYLRVLPSVQRKLAFRNQSAVPKFSQIRRQFVRPHPLSVTVNRATSNKSITRASLVQAIMEKVYEANDLLEEQGTDEEQPLPDRTVENPDSPSAPGPFVCTPLADRSRTTIQDASEVIFPNAKESIRLSEQSSVFASPMRSKPSFLATPATHSIRKSRVQQLRNQSLVCELQSLLKTPPVVRRTLLRTPSEAPSLSQAPADLNASSSTPQSILKVKTPASTHTPLQGIAKLKSLPGEIGWPTPPIPSQFSAGMQAYLKMHLPASATVASPLAQADATPVAAAESEVRVTPSGVKSAENASSVSTPKQLRFAMEEEEDAKSECSGQEEEEEELEEEEAEPEEAVPEEGKPEEVEPEGEREEHESEGGEEEGEKEMDTGSPVRGNALLTDIGLSPAAVRALRGSVLLETVRLKQSAQRTPTPERSPSKSVLRESLTPTQKRDLSSALDTCSEAAPSEAESEKPGPSQLISVGAKSAEVDNEVSVDVEVDEDVTFHFSADPSKTEHMEVEAPVKAVEAPVKAEDTPAPEVTPEESKEEGPPDVEPQADQAEEVEEAEELVLEMEVSGDEGEEPEEEEDGAKEVETEKRPAERDASVISEDVKEKTPSEVEAAPEFKASDEVQEEAASVLKEEDAVSEEAELSDKESKVTPASEADDGEVTSATTQSETETQDEDLPDVGSVKEETSAMSEEVTEEEATEDTHPASQPGEAEPVVATPRRRTKRDSEASEDVPVTPSRRSSRIRARMNQSLTSAAATPAASSTQKKKQRRSIVGRVAKLEVQTRKPSRSNKRVKKVVSFLLSETEIPDEMKSVLRSTKKSSRISQTPSDIGLSSSFASTPPPAPKSRSRSRRHSRSLSPTDTESVTSSQTETEDTLAPLKSSPQMSKLRPKRGGQRGSSRESSPDTTSLASEDDFVEGSKFTFSEPMAVDSSRDADDLEAETAETPVRPFVFSPPLTRSQSRHVSSDTPLKTPSSAKRTRAAVRAAASPLIKTIHRHSLGGDSTPQSPGMMTRRRSLAASTPTSDLPARNTRASSIKKAPKADSAKASSAFAPTDSPINFLAPVKEEANADTSKPRVRKTTASKYNMRPRRKTLKW